MVKNIHANGKVALITGAGSGIGRAAALALQRTGHTVVLAGRKIVSLNETRDLGQKKGPKMVSVPTDIGIESEIVSLFKQIQTNFGRLDLLFNNAGVGTPNVPTEEVTLEDWNTCVSVNLTGAFLCSREAIRIMKTQSPKGGRIINNGSVSAHVPRPHSAAYTATKHGMTGLTKSIALDGRQHDIACSQIDIGNADTALAAQMKTGMLQPDGEVCAEPVIDVHHCSETIAHIANLPLDTNVMFVTLMATKMPYVGRG